MSATRDRLAVVAALVWVAGAVAARRYGIWIGIGLASVMLGVTTLALRATTLAAVATDAPGALGRARAARLVAGVAVGAAMAAATYALYPVVVALSPASARQAQQLYASFAALPPAMAALLLAPVIVGEELVWRGVVQEALAPRLGVAAAVLVAAAVYALAHAAVGSSLLVVVAFGCGLVWSTLRAVTGDLIAPLAAHLVWDVCVLIVRPLAH